MTLDDLAERLAHALLGHDFRRVDSEPLDDGTHRWQMECGYDFCDTHAVQWVETDPETATITMLQREIDPEDAA